VQTDEIVTKDKQNCQNGISTVDEKDDIDGWCEVD